MPGSGDFAGRRAKGIVAASALFLAVAAVEVLLRVCVDSLPMVLANEVASGYHARHSGIYRYNAKLDMFLMRPHYERKMFFNGYHWHHRTDAMGFRNPQDRSSADVVLLGDSMVYGHGLEETSTIRHHLESMLGRPVANLGMQGAGIHEEYQVLKRFGLALRPRFVFLFFLVNDVSDLVALHDDGEMQRFLATPVDDHVTTYVDGSPAGFWTRWKALAGDLYAVRALRLLQRELSLSWSAHAEAAEPRWTALPPFRSKGPRQVLAMRFHLHALEKMQNLAARHQFTFVNVFIWTGRFADEEPFYADILDRFCREHGIAFLNLRDAEQTLADRERLFLPGDGHFSDFGARWVAGLLADTIRSGGSRGTPSHLMKQTVPSFHGRGGRGDGGDQSGEG